MGAEDIEEELAKSGSEIARVLHLETKRGRILPELLIVGSVVFDREAAELERQAIAKAKEQLAIAKSMTSASQRQRANPAASSQRRPQRKGCTPHPRVRGRRCCWRCSARSGRSNKSKR